jgi:ABC-type lipoprotein export system ATPase subunit
MLSARDLQFSYPQGEFALSVSEFDVAAGETLGIMGPSGAGKTTLLRLLSGILLPLHGTVKLHDDDITKLPGSARREMRLKKLGLVFQDFALLDYLSVEDNLFLPMRLGGLPVDEVRERAQELIGKLDMAKHWGRLTGELSQGERQRVAVVRSLLHKPLAVFADEPTSSLDGSRKEAVMELLTADAKARGAALIVVTHDAEMKRWFDRVVDFSSLKS